MGREGIPSRTLRRAKGIAAQGIESSQRIQPQALEGIQAAAQVPGLPLGLALAQGIDQTEAVGDPQGIGSREDREGIQATQRIDSTQGIRGASSRLRRGIDSRDPSRAIPVPFPAPHQ